MADRYTYLPMVGLAIVVGWSGFQFHQSQGERRPWLAPALAALACAALLTSSSLQLRCWRDSVNLFERAYAIEPTNVLVNVSLG